MRVVALLAVRNEALYLQRCLKHLGEHGVETCIIDNDSTDETRSIAESFLGRGVFRIDRLPYRGHLDLVALLTLKQSLAAEIGADWFIHHDADEIREAHALNVTLKQGIAEADAQGFNAIDFDEFVFVPPDLTTSAEGRDYVAEMQFYYHFAPRPLHRVNAWKKTAAEIDLVTGAGHEVRFAGRNIYPHRFALRHYIALSAQHANRKYGVERVYNPEETLERGWRRERLSWRHKTFVPPARDTLKRFAGAFDRSDPQAKHLFSFEAEAPDSRSA